RRHAHEKCKITAHAENALALDMDREASRRRVVDRQRRARLHRVDDDSADRQLELGHMRGIQRLPRPLRRRRSDSRARHCPAPSRRDPARQARVSSILRNTPLRKPTVLTPKSLRRILQVTEGITANIFHMINSLAADVAQSGQERITDEGIESWRPLSDGGAAFA